MSNTIKMFASFVILTVFASSGTFKDSVVAKVY